MFRKIFSIGLIVIGALLMGASFYIKAEVAKGKVELSSTEQKIDAGKSLFSLNPVSKEIGGQLTKSADRKIKEAHDEIGYYTNLASNLLIVGIVFLVVGFGYLIFYGRKSK